jgi:hypothetical protein
MSYLGRPHLEFKTRPLMVASYMKIFLVLFFVLLVGCVKLSVGCDIDKIDMNNKQAALEKCKENPNVTVKGAF